MILLTRGGSPGILMAMSNAVGPKRVLVVDDEPEVTFALRVFFLGKGYEMLTALDGAQAMEQIRQQPIDLVLLDMKLPGVNGIEVLKFVHAHSPTTRVVVVTAYDAQFQDRVERLGVEGFLTKPFGIQALTHAIEEVLAGRKILPVPAGAELSPPPAAPLPKARLLFVEPAEYTYKLKELYFQDPERCGGHFQVAPAYSAEEAVAQMESFRPDILLVDLSLMGPSGELAARLMAASFKPQEVILHGSKSVFSSESGQNLQQLSRLEVKMVQNESFTRAGLIRLGEVIRATAVRHGLVETS